MAESVNLEVRVWCRSDVSTEEQGFKVVGAPIGHDDFVRRLLAMTSDRVLWTPSRLWCNQRESCCSIVLLHERTAT